MSQLFSKIYEGGPVFMYPILVLLVLILILIVKGFINKRDNGKIVTLISSLGLFTVVWGFLGQTIGLIAGFDQIQQMGTVSTQILVGGLKVSLLSPAFGLITFLIARLGIIVLVLVKKPKQ